MDFLSIGYLRGPIEPRNVGRGRQPAGGINRLSNPRAVLETIYTGRHNGAIDIDIDLCCGRRLRRRTFGCLSARGIAGSWLHQRARTISALKRHAAGTAAEVTINYVITDPEKVRKFVCVDTSDAPEVAVVDPDMMASMPAGLTASTGMDALTHAIEGYTTKGAWELSDMFHFEAIKLISENLRDSVAEAKSGQPGSGREGMALGQYVAGMGFSNVGLGIDHAMAHTLSAHYDTPHGVACAMLLPIAMEFNKPVCAERLAKVAVAMGVDTTGMSTDEAADAAIAAVKQLSADVNIPHVCEAMKADEIEVLAKDAMADACFPGNPREATLDDVIELFKKICPAA